MAPSRSRPSPRRQSRSAVADVGDQLPQARCLSESGVGSGSVRS